MTAIEHLREYVEGGHERASGPNYTIGLEGAREILAEIEKLKTCEKCGGNTLALAIRLCGPCMDDYVKHTQAEAEKWRGRWEKLKAGGEKREAGNREQHKEWEVKKNPPFVPYSGCFGEFADEDRHWLAAMREIEGGEE